MGCRVQRCDFRRLRSGRGGCRRLSLRPVDSARRPVLRPLNFSQHLLSLRRRLRAALVWAGNDMELWRRPSDPKRTFCGQLAKRSRGLRGVLLRIDRQRVDFRRRWYWRRRRRRLEPGAAGRHLGLECLRRRVRVPRWADHRQCTCALQRRGRCRSNELAGRESWQHPVGGQLPRVSVWWLWHVCCGRRRR